MIHNPAMLAKRRNHWRFTFISISVILTISVAVSIFIHLSRPAAAAIPPDSCFQFNVGTGTITKYYNNQGNNTANPACPTIVDIPSTISGVPVQGFGLFAFQSTAATSVVIPNSVTTIGDYAFYFSNVESVVIPDSVTSIGNRSFYFSKLRAVTIPDSVTEIGYLAFASNEITALTLGQSVTTVGMSAFSGNQLTTVTIPDSVADIGAYAFEHNQLNSIIFPANGAVAIGYGAFRSNSLTALTLPASVMEVEEKAFAANNLASVTVEGNPLFFYSDGDDKVRGGNPFEFNGIDWSTTSYGDGSCEYTNACKEYYQQHAQIVRINAADPAFAATYPHGVSIQEMWDDDYTEMLGWNVTGAYITNPTTVAVGYQDVSGLMLRPDTVAIGMTGSGTPLLDYRLGHLVNTLNVTDSEWPYRFSTDISAYFRTGEMVDLSPFNIQGYTRPKNQSVMLLGAGNVVTFVYTTDTDNSILTPSAPNAGVGVRSWGIPSVVLVATVLLLLCSGLAAVARRR